MHNSREGQVIPESAARIVLLEGSAFFRTRNDDCNGASQFSEKSLPDRARRYFDEKMDVVTDIRVAIKADAPTLCEFLCDVMNVCAVLGMKHREFAMRF